MNLLLCNSEEIYLKENSKEISLFLKDYLTKKRKLTREQIAEILNIHPGSVSRKFKNDKSLFTLEDLQTLSSALGVSYYFLSKQSNYETEDKETEELNKKAKLKEEYKTLLKYLKTIGVEIKPGYYWSGTEIGLYYSFEEIEKYLSLSALEYIKNTFDNFADINPETLNDNIDNTVYLKLKDIPENIEITNLNDISKQNDVFSYEEFYYFSFIEIRFDIITQNKTNKNISIEELNKLLSLIDLSNISLIENFLKCMC